MSQEQNPTGANQDNQPIKLDEELSADELKAQQQNEDFIANFKEEDLADEEKSKQLKDALKTAKTTVAQKRHYRTKYQEATKPKAAEKPNEQPTKPAASDDSKEVILELRQDNPWMSKETAAEVVRLSKANNESVEATLKRTYVASWLEKEKNAADVESASVTPKRNGGGAADSMGDKDWSNATPEEMEKKRLEIMSRGQ